MGWRRPPCRLYRIRHQSPAQIAVPGAPAQQEATGARDPRRAHGIIGQPRAHQPRLPPPVWSRGRGDLHEGAPYDLGRVNLTTPSGAASNGSPRRQGA
jgi:hypothetical protein